MAQNIISAGLTAEQLTAIQNNLTELREQMPFLLALSKAQRKKMPKLGNTFKPFVSIAEEVVNQHPQIISPLFSKEEFLRDTKLMRDLVPIYEKSVALTEALNNTIFAAGSDALVESLEIYAAVLANKDKVPGLEDVASRMAAFFERKRTKKEDPPAQPQS